MGDAMPYDRFRQHRGTLRLRGYDYRRAAAYFITIRTADIGNVMGEVDDAAVELNEIGRAIESCWRDLPNHHQGLRLDAWAVMPDHLHGILVLPHGVPESPRARRGAQQAASK